MTKQQTFSNQARSTEENSRELVVAHRKLQSAIDELNRGSEDLSEYPGYIDSSPSLPLQGENTEARLIVEQLEGSFGDDPEFLNIFGVALRRKKFS